MSVRRRSIQVPILTPWVAYTPTGSWVSNAVYTGLWRRVGEVMEIQIKVATSGAVTATTLQVLIPTGYTIDTTKLINGTNNQQPLGQAVYDNSGGTNAYVGSVKYSSTVQVRFVYASGANNDESAIDEGAPMTWGAGDVLNAYCRVPINGWKATRSV